MKVSPNVELHSKFESAKVSDMQWIFTESQLRLSLIQIYSGFHIEVTPVFKKVRLTLSQTVSIYFHIILNYF